MRRARAPGFTLIELLVVLVIIGVLATLVGLSVSGRATDDRMQAESRRLEQIFRLASDEAQVNGVELGFRYTTEGFDFLTLDPGGNWVPIPEGPFRPRTVPAPFFLELRVEGRLIKPVETTLAAAAGEKDKDGDGKGDKFFDNEAHKKAEDKVLPQVLIMSTGEMTAFTLDLKLKDYRSYYRLEGDEVGGLKSERYQDRS
ncbi:MAG TPA: type II secretion system minor pseudopilin GspH [Nevskiaceae bacterium]|nr:type II secretion system minor pseudopilin GspH [Nevskiaceae bacterium]